jgi:hypothetical protein
MILKACGAFLVINWMLCGAITIYSGGNALCGEISDGQYLICRHYMSSAAIPVSREFWIFSLLYTSLTISLTFLILALLMVFSRPRWDRGVIDVVAVSFSILWLLAIARKAIPRFYEWVAI